MCKPFIKTLL